MGITVLPLVTIPSFQFLYGAIKCIEDLIASYNKNPFQFLYGAIKWFDMEGSFEWFSLFQFLYGAIKWKSKADCAFMWKKFQFLYGAIKCFAKFLDSWIAINFNSSMVRLNGRDVPIAEINKHISIPLWCD